MFAFIETITILPSYKVISKIAENKKKNTFSPWK
jgi:hypothetical protein